MDPRQQQTMHSRKSIKRLLFLTPLLLTACHNSPRLQHASKAVTPQHSPTQSTYVFGWGYQQEPIAKPRGGTTHGTKVELAPPVKSTPRLGATAFEEDRNAILAMAGDYQVSFHFMETLGLTEGYTNTRPYSSWATEHIRVLEDRKDFISLQHTLVMFFAEKGDEKQAPMLMKHWRQDWTYEDTNLHLFKGNHTWSRQRRPAESVAGAWSQAVFHVDDSPRYEVVGRWQHRGNVSRWTSEQDWRPLPRREHSARKDYDVLEGRHQIVLTPTGWVHEQDNWKRVTGGTRQSPPEYLAQEWGINRYERITKPSLIAADDYWKKTSAYWAAVRRTWHKVMTERDRFQLKPSVNEQSLFEIHFTYADALAQGKSYDAEEGERHARESIESFLER